MGFYRGEAKRLQVVNPRPEAYTTALSEETALKKKELQSVKNSIAAERERANSQLTETRRAVLDAQERLGKINDAISRGENELSRLSKQRESVISEVMLTEREQEEKVYALKVEIAKAEDRLKEINANTSKALASQRAQEDNLKARIESIDASIFERQKIGDVLRDSISSQESEKQKLADEIKSLEHEKNNAKQAVSELLGKSEYLKAEIVCIEAEKQASVEEKKAIAEAKAKNEADAKANTERAKHLQTWENMIKIEDTALKARLSAVAKRERSLQEAGGKIV